MRRTRPALLLALALSSQACAERVTAPDDDYDPGRYDAISVSPTPIQGTPPLQIGTFWTCAAQAEGRFADAASTIFVLEARALSTADPVRQALLFAQVATLKHEAKKALYFAIEQCVATYGAPRFFAYRDASGNLVLELFTVGAYHGYLVRKYLER